MEDASIFRNTWVEKQLDTGPIYKVVKEEGEFQFWGRTWKRPVCWITNRKNIYEEIHDDNRLPMQETVRRGLLKQLSKDGILRDEHDRYVSYVVEENQWEGSEGTA